VLDGRGGGHGALVRGFGGLYEGERRGGIQGLRKKSRCALVFLGLRRGLDRGVLRGSGDIVGRVYSPMNLMRAASKNIPAALISTLKCEGGDTLNIKSTTNSLMTLPQLPGQMGCLSSSS
jgi:hypothetical protein